jgi:hypothetical protein
MQQGERLGHLVAATGTEIRGTKRLSFKRRHEYALAFQAVIGNDALADGIADLILFQVHYQRATATETEVMLTDTVIPSVGPGLFVPFKIGAARLSDFDDQVREMLPVGPNPPCRAH